MRRKLTDICLGGLCLLIALAALAASLVVPMAAAKYVFTK